MINTFNLLFIFLLIIQWNVGIGSLVEKKIISCDVPGRCSQICIKKKGAVKCQCHSGYIKDPKQDSKCRATVRNIKLMYIPDRSLKTISIDDSTMAIFQPYTRAPSGLDFVFKTGMIFWSDVYDHKIYKTRIDKSGERTSLIFEDKLITDNIAVDWIYNNIYWSNINKNNLVVSTMNGKMRKVLFTENPGRPMAIALHPNEGTMFWTQVDDDAKIYRSGMDGSNRKIIIADDLDWPSGITIDFVNKRLFWIDTTTHKISSCNYDGRKRVLLLHSKNIVGIPVSITTFEDWIYWTDYDNNVKKANKFTGKDFKIITREQKKMKPMSILVFHPYRQPGGKNFCGSSNGNCSHLCLPAPRINSESKRYSCACPEGFVLKPDGYQCLEVLAEDQEYSTTEPIDERNSTNDNSELNLIFKRISDAPMYVEKAAIWCWNSFRYMNPWLGPSEDETWIKIRKKIRSPDDINADLLTKICGMKFTFFKSCLADQYQKIYNVSGMNTSEKSFFELLISKNHRLLDKICNTDEGKALAVGFMQQFENCNFFGMASCLKSFKDSMEEQKNMKFGINYKQNPDNDLTTFNMRDITPDCELVDNLKQCMEDLFLRTCNLTKMTEFSNVFLDGILICHRNGTYV